MYHDAPWKPSAAGLSEELSTEALEPSLLPGLEKFTQTISDISPNTTPKGSELSWKNRF